MAYTQLAIDDDDSIARLFERRQQEFRSLDRRTIGGAHRLTLRLSAIIDARRRAKFDCV
jgi:hypothetical protein